MRGSAHKHIAEVEQEIMQNYRDKFGQEVRSELTDQTKTTHPSQKFIDRQSIGEYMSDNISHKINYDSIARRSNEMEGVLQGAEIEPGT
jgi:hypothetical protein